MNKDTFIDEDIITSSNKVFQGFESDIAVVVWTLCNLTWETVKWYGIVK